MQVTTFTNGIKWVTTFTLTSLFLQEAIHFTPFDWTFLFM